MSYPKISNSSGLESSSKGIVITRAPVYECRFMNVVKAMGADKTVVESHIANFTQRKPQEQAHSTPVPSTVQNGQDPELITIQDDAIGRNEVFVWTKGSGTACRPCSRYQ
jgi:hypothetical protein